MLSSLQINFSFSIYFLRLIFLFFHLFILLSRFVLVISFVSFFSHRLVGCHHFLQGMPHEVFRFFLQLELELIAASKE